MITKCKKGIITWLIKSGVIEASDRELYEYALHSLWLLVAPLIIAIVFGIIMGSPGEAVIMILPFMAVRKFSGGYHAKRERNCLIGSSLLVMLCIYCTDHLEYGVTISICLILATISLTIFSPINSENHRLDSDEKSRYKVVTAVIAIIVCALSIILATVGFSAAAVCIAVGQILSAVLQIPCVVMHLMKIEY